MSLADLNRREDDKRLRCAIQNAFALLTDSEILEVCTELSGSSPASASAAIINLVGPESGRVGALLPAQWAPNVLADQDVAAMVLTSIGKNAGATSASKDDVAKTVNTLPITPEEGKAIISNLDKEVTGALDWALVGRLLSQVVIAVASKKLPMLKYAGRSQALIKGIGTAAGAAYGFGHNMPSLPLPPEK
jgi:hypothetical protein